MHESVECRSDFEYAQHPMAFTWQGHRYQVERIIVHWRTPEGKCFRVLTTKHDVFFLTYHLKDDDWSIEPIGSA